MESGGLLLGKAHNLKCWMAVTNADQRLNMYHNVCWMSYINLYEVVVHMGVKFVLKYFVGLL